MSSHEQLPETAWRQLPARSRPRILRFRSIPRTWASDNNQFVQATNVQPLAQADVYVDNFLLAAQTKRLQSRLMRQALTAIDQVLRPVDATDPVHCKEPTSVKKLLQGDAAWSTQKRMLGWDIDTVRGTLALLSCRIDQLRDSRPASGFPPLNGIRFWKSSVPCPPASRGRAANFCVASDSQPRQ